MCRSSRPRGRGPRLDHPRARPARSRSAPSPAATCWSPSSWFLIAALIAWTVSPRVDEVSPGLGGLKYVAGFAFAVVLYLSVLLHEASHAYMARHFGFKISSITLHFLGGATAIDGEARTPRQEFLIAVVGPLTSLAVGGAALGLWFVTPDGLLLMAVEGLAGANLIVGLLNLVPGLPLDGGRVLKSVVWGATGSMLRGTVVAAWGGRVVAILALGWPLAQERVLGTPPDIFDFVIAGMVALFLWTGASAALSSARARITLPALVARQLARRTLAVPDDLPLGRGRPPGPRGRGGQHHHRDRQRRPGRAWSARRRCWPRPRSGARGSRSPPWRAPSSPGSGCRPRSAARSWSARCRRCRRRSTSSWRRTARSTACCRPATSRTPSGQPPAVADGAARVSAMPPHDPDVPPEAWSGVHRGPLRAGEWVRLTRHQGPAPQLLPRGRASASSPTAATSSTTS